MLLIATLVGCSGTDDADDGDRAPTDDTCPPVTDTLPTDTSPTGPTGPTGDTSEPIVRLENPETYERVDDVVAKINDHVWMAADWTVRGTAAYLVATPEGNVVIDTSREGSAIEFHDALRAVAPGPIEYVILTHAHDDHIGGVDLWVEAGTEVVAHAQHVPFQDYRKRLEPHLEHYKGISLSGSPGGPFAAPDAPVDNHAGEILATLLVDDSWEFRLGGLTFQLLHTPGETPDMLSVWIPEYRLAFIGDNLYDSFPNLYTLRGSPPRWALDWAGSLDRILALGPEVIVRGHGEPLYGQEATDRLVQYRDAILYVHDETVRGMNAGKDVHTLMDEIVVPTELDPGQIYGTARWSVRGIYTAYVGWFDHRVASMYAVSPAQTNVELVALAGGATLVANRALQLMNAGQLEQAEALIEAALDAEPDNAAALAVQMDILERLSARTNNFNELGWLHYAHDVAEGVQ